MCARFDSIPVGNHHDHYYSYNRLFMKDNHFTDTHTHQHTNSGLLSHLFNDTEAKPHNQFVGWFKQIAVTDRNVKTKNSGLLRSEIVNV